MSEFGMEDISSKEFRRHIEKLVDLGILEKEWSDEVGDWKVRMAVEPEEGRKILEEFRKKSGEKKTRNNSE